MRINSYTIIVAILLVGVVAGQQYGQRIGRRQRQNLIGIPEKSARRSSFSDKIIRTGRRNNNGYSYLPPSNPLLLPSTDVKVIQSIPTKAVQQPVINNPLPPPVIESIRVQSIQPQLPQPQQQPQQQLTVVDDEIAFWDLRESIPGDPELDYPILNKIPATSFQCRGQVDGYYADTETRCQVFHVCTSIPSVAEPIKASFLCPNGTLFNQESFVCQWWPDVNCPSSPQFYSLNRNIGVVPERKNQL